MDPNKMPIRIETVELKSIHYHESMSGHHDIEQAQHFDHVIRKPCNAPQLEALTKLINEDGR